MVIGKSFEFPAPPWEVVIASSLFLKDSIF